MPPRFPFSITLRRLFLPLVAAIAFFQVPASLPSASAAPAAAPAGAANASGLQLGLQCWTFRRFTFLETLDKAQNLGFTLLQAYPGQALGGGLPGGFGPDMSADTRQTVRGWLAERGLSVVSMGVTHAKDDAAWTTLLAFAKEMGIKTITIEPPLQDLPMIDRMTKDSGLRIAYHDHPKPTIWADPAFALSAIKPYGNHFGLCADTGHWTRSGFDPVASLRLAEGRIFELHFKDVSEPHPKAHDMPWGTGIGQAAGQIAELRRQKFSGVAFLEYEHDTPELEANIALSAAFFRAALRAPLDTLLTGGVVPPGYTADPAALWRDRGASSPAKWPAAQPLLAPDLSNAEFAEGTWAWEDGVLVAKGGGDLWTKASYDDFVLSLEFRTEAGSNSGVFVRTSDTVNWLHNSIEVQILQGDAENPRHVVGSLFDVLAPARQLPIEPGQWHRFVIIARGAKLQVHLDGEPIIDADLNLWTTAGKNPDESPNKFAKAYRDMAREGRIGLQYHGNPIAFRNLLIEKL